MSEYNGHKCSEPGCTSKECACNNCHKCQEHHDEEIKMENRVQLSNG